jgi:hypothetical protein
VNCSGSNESAGEFVCLRAIPPRNRVKEISLEARTENVCGCDLLAEDDRRPDGFDEPEQLRPQVAFVVLPLSLPGA